jgi:hypothetical protein
VQLKGVLDVAEQLENPHQQIEDKERLQQKLKRTRLLMPSKLSKLSKQSKQSKVHAANDYIEEELQTRILIVEYLIVHGRIEQFRSKFHPCDKCPRVATFWEWQVFRFGSLVIQKQNLRLYCITKEKGDEQGIEFQEIMWPVYERFQVFSGVSL